MIRNSVVQGTLFLEMCCPNCDNDLYEIGTPCSDCDYYEKPQYWNLGFCVIRIEPKNWAVCYNGHPVEQEFASYRDAQDAAYIWDEEMTELSNMGKNDISRYTELI